MAGMILLKSFGGILGQNYLEAKASKQAATAIKSRRIGDRLG